MPVLLGYTPAMAVTRRYVLLLLALAIGCSTPGDESCSFDEECAEGSICVDERCTPRGDVGPRETDASVDAADASADVGADARMVDVSADTSAEDAVAEDVVADAEMMDARFGPTDVHTRPQSKSEMLLFDPARDVGETISYHTFRIPALVKAGSTLIAFAEARQCAHDDFGNINLVYRRSSDDGRTWGPLEEVVGRGPGTWGNPTPVYDADTGELFLFLSFNAADVSQYGRVNPCTGDPTRVIEAGERPVWLFRSSDEGATWDSGTNLTSTLQPEGWAWDAMGPGAGIQTQSGRLVIPAIRRNIFSDDHGATWRYQLLPSGTSEGTVAELVDGTLLRNDRAVGRVWETANRRWLSRGTIDETLGEDPGLFSDFEPHDTLLDPRVQGSTWVYTRAPHRLIFLNPASTVERCRMRVRMSYDGGRTWPMSRGLHSISASATCDQDLGGYSSLARTGDYHMAALVERRGARGSIEFHRFNLPWIVDGTPEPL